MQIQINSDNVIKLGDAASAAISETVASRLARFADRLTRIEVHVSDINGRESTVGDDKRCVVEARPASRAPVTVTHEAASVDAALSGALPKLITALERDFGRITTRKGH